MKRTWAVLVFALVFTRPIASQDLRGFLLLDGQAGYLTNGYLEPAFATWTPELESGFGAIAATGLLAWDGERTAVAMSAAGRVTGWTGSERSWRSFLLRGVVEQQVARGLSLAVQTSFADIRQLASRKTLWGQVSLRWTISPWLRLGLGPGLARTRFGESRTVEAGAPGPPPSGSELDAEPDPRADSYVLLANAEAWPATRWQVRGEGYASRTDAEDLGIDSDGLGGSLRLTRWLGNGASVTLGGRIEGFGYRAALEGGTAEIPEDDVIWRIDFGVSWPLGRRVELRSVFAGLDGPRSEGGRAMDVLTSLGVSVTLGGRLTAKKRAGSIWTLSAQGMRISVPYGGQGRLYVVGDFNDWADPGTPLLDEGDGGRSATLVLAPGSYRYRIRLVEGGISSWLELPEGAITEDDGFGGRNGVLIVSGDVSGKG
jgi:hypothetical protein